jgi:hypothetical protein
MGVKLLKLYEEVKARGGIAAMVKLAAKTRIPSAAAATEPDSAELMAKFLAVIKEHGL